jgi:hypothetical protein
MDKYDSRMNKLVFMMDLNKCRNNWSSDIKEIFIHFGIIEHFNNRTSITLDTVKTQLVNLYQTKLS